MLSSELIDNGTLRILVLGDSGVGKTSLLQFICCGEDGKNSSCKVQMTIGCSIHVKTHNYKGGNKSFFVEFWDIGANPKHERSRTMFYSQIDGIILVYSANNRKSLTNLDKWTKEYRENCYTESDSMSLSSSLSNSMNPEIGNEAAGSRSPGPLPPTLTIANKMDLVQQQATKLDEEESAGDKISASAWNGKYDETRFNQFLDKVIERCPRISSSGFYSVSSTLSTATNAPNIAAATTKKMKLNND